MNTPINNGLAQNDIDFSTFKVRNADLSDYAGSGMSWNPATKKFDSSGGLPERTVTSNDIGLVGDGVTDNTAALQAWFDTMDGDGSGLNHTLIVEDGCYIFSGPLQDPSGRNAQILLPRPTVIGQALTIKGRQAIPIWVTADALPGGPLPMPAGARFKSTLATGGGTQPSFIGGHGDLAQQNGLHLCIENMIFQTVDNSPISCLNLELISWIDFTRDVLIIGGSTMGMREIVEPTTSSSCGLILTMVNIGVLHSLENVHVFGFYNGIRFGEIAHCKNVGIYGCKNALQFGSAYHANLIERVLIFHCTKGIVIDPLNGAILSAPLQVIQMDIEHDSGTVPWQTTVYDIDDPNNYGIGDVTWWVVLAYSGIDTTFTKNGGTGIKARRIGGAY